MVMLADSGICTRARPAGRWSTRRADGVHEPQTLFLRHAAKLDFWNHAEQGRWLYIASHYRQESRDVNGTRYLHRSKQVATTCSSYQTMAQASHTDTEYLRYRK